MRYLRSLLCCAALVGLSSLVACDGVGEPGCFATESCPFCEEGLQRGCNIATRECLCLPIMGTGGGGGTAGTGGTAGMGGSGEPSTACETDCAELDCVEFVDGDFADAAWSDDTFNSNGVASYEASTESDEGNPAPYRLVTHTLGENSLVRVAHQKPAANYDPSTAPIVSIHFTVEGNALAGSLQAFVGPMVEQGGERFVPDALRINEADGWVSRDWTDADFDDSLDLSSNGAPLTFGFTTAASHTVGAPEVIRATGVDNWSVRICVTPSP